MVKVFCNATNGRDEDALVMTYRDMIVLRPQDLSGEFIGRFKDRALEWLHNNYTGGCVMVSAYYIDDDGEIALGYWTWDWRGRLVD